MTTKEAIVKAMQELAADASYEDAIERLYILYRIELGLAEVKAGRTVTQEEAVKRMAKWLR